MLEVIARFPAIGTIGNYQSLPTGERLLYDQFTLLKLEEEHQRVGCMMQGKSKA